MMNIVKMNVEHQAPFHFGDAEGHLSETFSSSQLFSAIVNNINLLYGEEKVREFITFAEKDEWILSSLLYGLDLHPKGEDQTVKTIYFVPRPKIDFRFTQDGFMSHKEMKKVEYVSVALFKRLSEAWDPHLEVSILNREDVLIFSKKFAVLKEEALELDIAHHEWQSLSFMSTQVRPGVAVNRLNGKSDHYFSQEELIFRYQDTRNYLIKPFLYFYLEGPTPSYVTAAIHFMADEGIGGKRSFGRGFLKSIEIFESPVVFLKEGSLIMTLSDYFPKKEEIGALYSYELAKKNGYVHSNHGTTLRKKSILVVKEGSLLRNKVKGQILDIRPEIFPHHPVYFYGTPLLIGFGGMPS